MFSSKEPTKFIIFGLHNYYIDFHIWIRLTFLGCITQRIFFLNQSIRGAVDTVQWGNCLACSWPWLDLQHSIGWPEPHQKCPLSTEPEQTLSTLGMWLQHLSKKIIVKIRPFSANCERLFISLYRLGLTWSEKEWNHFIFTYISF